MDSEATLVCLKNVWGSSALGVVKQNLRCVVLEGVENLERGT